MSGITDREKGLLVGAAVILLSTFYFVVRIQPQIASIKALAEIVAALEKNVNSAVLPRNTGDPDTVQKQLVEVNAQLKRSRDALDALFKKRVDEGSNQALEGLMLEILTLASAKGVAIDTSGVYVGSFADFVIISKEELTRLQADEQPFRFRPLRSLSLRGYYPQIQNFIKELPELRHEVNVLRFSIKPDGNKSRDQNNAAQSRGLRAELVLAL